MRIKFNLLLGVIIFIALGFNPGACSKGCRSCSKGCDDAARHSDDLGRHSDDLAKSTRYSDEFNHIPTSDESARSNTYVNNSDGTYTYKNTTYQSFDDIPFHSTEIVYTERGLTSEEAASLMNKGVNFVYNEQAATIQSAKNFKVIYLMSEDLPTVSALYDLDRRHAQMLIDYSSEIINNDQIFKVRSYDEMVEKQAEILGNDEVPVVVFHNGTSIDASMFDARTNLITCNSFTLLPDSYLTSTNFLDLKGIAKAVNASYDQPTLGEFYQLFAQNYNSYMSSKRRLRMLLYVGGGLGVGGGIGAIAYYNSDNTENTENKN